MKEEQKQEEKIEEKPPENNNEGDENKTAVSKDMTENVTENKNEGDKKLTKKEQVIEFFKFLAFSLSAGVIQIASFELLYHIIKWDMWWPCYLISIVLSVVWNFTFNRKFTFKSASNVPLAMTFVLIYYAAFIPLSVFGGDALEAAGWHGTLVTVIMMVINFATEFLWDKFIVFNDKLMAKIIDKLILHKKEPNS